MPENPFEFPMAQPIDVVQESYNMSQTKTNNKNIFRDCVFVLEFDILTKLKEKQHWRKKITEHGGTVSYVFTRKVRMYRKTHYEEFMPTSQRPTECLACNLCMKIVNIFILSFRTIHRSPESKAQMSFLV